MDARSPLSSPHDRPTLALNHRTADQILTFLHFFSPCILLFFFLTAFTIRSIRVSNPEKPNPSANGHAQHAQLYGPGGKPLPQRKLTGLRRKRDKENDFPVSQKLTFQWFQIFATLTFFASAAVSIIHVLTDRGWWCGQEQVVSRLLEDIQTFLIYKY